MKVIPEHFAKLREAVNAVDHAALKDYQAEGFGRQQWRWDCLHMAKIDGEPATRWLYREGYNDNHIDTALRRIALELESN